MILLTGKRSKIKMCEICGDGFELPAHAHGKYCPGCRKEAYKNNHRVAMQQARLTSKITARRQKKPRAMHTLVQIAKEAGEAGLSYGKYVERLHDE
jgi:hypothetical protein